MPTLTPIPTPSAQRWREIRMHAVPPAVFLAALATAASLWRDYVAAPTLVGEVESIQATVTSYKPGVLGDLNVARFQHVRAGEALAHVAIADPRILTSQLAVIQAEIELLRSGMRPVLVQQRNVMDYDQLRLDWMRQRAQLAMSRANLQLAEADFRRQSELFREKIISERVFDQAKATREKYRAEFEELSRLVAEQEQNFKRLSLDPNLEPSQVATNALQASIAVQEGKLRLAEAELSPITLRVPMDGMISMIYRHSGESVGVGQPIVTISAARSDRIVGYLHQPMAVEPQVGMAVQVRTRGAHPAVSVATITGVGAQMELISPALLPPLRLTTNSQLGLPISVSLPGGVRLRPGELVDLTLLPKVRAGVARSRP